MAIKKKELFIEYELKFLEKKLKELKKYISDNPFSRLDDRTGISSMLTFKDGTQKESYRVIATKESQRKDLTSALKDYAEILRTVDQMREEEDKKKIDVRGGEKLGSKADRFLKERK